MGRARRGIAWCTAAMLSGAAACGDEPAGTVGAGVVQITSVLAAPTAIRCPNVGALGVVAPVYAYVRMVNTRADTVRITNVSSTGSIVASSAESFTGQARFNYEKLPYSEIVLRPRDGEAQTTVIIDTPCPSSGGPTTIGIGPGLPPAQLIGPGGFIETYLTLYVKTNAGIYTTSPLTIRFNYPRGG